MGELTRRSFVAAAVTAAFCSGSATAQNASDRPELHARENLVHVLLNHHDFVTIR